MYVRIVTRQLSSLREKALCTGRRHGGARACCSQVMTWQLHVAAPLLKACVCSKPHSHGVSCPRILGASWLARWPPRRPARRTVRQRRTQRAVLAGEPARRGAKVIVPRASKPFQALTGFLAAQAPHGRLGTRAP
jgi:hypothetical protein